MSTPNTTKAAALIKALGETHAARVARATKELTEAQALLKSSGAKQKRFLATFRIRDPDSPAKGTSAQRREHLVARIRICGDSQSVLDVIHAMNGPRCVDGRPMGEG